MPLLSSPASRRAAWRRLAALTLVAATVPVSGCRDWIIRTRDAESISMAPNNFQVAVNSSVRVVGTAFDKNGNSIGDKNIRFSSANNAVATVTDEGLVIGVSPGQTIISGEADGARGEAAVTVVPEVPDNILVTPSPITLRRGNVRQFSAVPRNSAGTPITGLSLEWRSSNSAIASVSSTGEVTALAVGTAVISATANQITGSASVTVTEVPIGSISLAPATRSIQVNEEFVPELTLRDTAGNVLPSLGRNVNWTSSSTITASVNSGSGVVRGLRVGTTRITAASPDNPAINGSMDVTVTERLVKTVVITPRTGFLRLGVPRQLNAQLLDSLNQNVTGRVVTWTPLTPTVATVSPNGSVTGISLGTVRITAQVDAAVDTVQFTVTRIPVGDVDIEPTQTSVIQGKTTTLSVIVKDSVGTEVTDRTVNWSTSNPSVASVVNGVVTAVSPGTATITATSEGRSGTSSVTVLQVPVDSIALATPSDSTFSIAGAAPGNSKQVQLELLDADGGTVLNRNLLITSTSPSIANATWNQGTRILTVTATAGTAGGETIIRLRALGSNGLPEGKQTSIRVTVTAAP
ncbi:MAG TPA: Ig-like domain-containing protein [Gemmatimonadaceae bacterium]|nr:Ig-like domain-containing protein [Gemmatimonadaceae bacterium]